MEGACAVAVMDDDGQTLTVAVMGVGLTWAQVYPSNPLTSEVVGYY